MGEKSQTPNPKLQTNSKQTPNSKSQLAGSTRSRIQAPGLDFGVWSFFGFWDLEFGI
jgi:hypothetical protein